MADAFLPNTQGVRAFTIDDDGRQREMLLIGFRISGKSITPVIYPHGSKDLIVQVAPDAFQDVIGSKTYSNMPDVTKAITDRRVAKIVQ